ncbi:hypothetical protein GF325_04730 [Candidatus Bathyarchaeota archaeon]|nr:hypothetical protein [Candidatus Bathyarchaeota archaeon]
MFLYFSFDGNNCTKYYPKHFDIRYQQVKKAEVKKLGTPLRFTANNHLLFRIHKPGSRVIGRSVANEKMEVIGKVHDLFGPINQPFLSVSLKSKNNDISIARLTKSTFFLLHDNRQHGKRYSPRRKKSK